MASFVLIVFFTLSTIIIVTNVSAENICETCECSVVKNFTKLNCSNRERTRVLENWPESFSEQMNNSDIHLDISYNDNEILWLNKLPKTQNIVSLCIRRCNIQYLEYAPFRDVKNIKILDLGYNKITAENLKGDLFKGPFNIEQYEPIELEVLNLEYNLIHSLPKKLFEHTPKLNSLYLNGNPMNVIDSVTILAISSLKNIEILDISDVGISKIPNDLLRSSKKLQQLNLSDNRLKTVPEALGYVSLTLEVLKLNNNSIEELNDNSFLGLTNLQSLEVGSMETLLRVKAATFEQLHSLKILHLCHNKNLNFISHQAFRQLREKWPIKELYLNDNNLKSLHGDLAEWKSTVNLQLQDNPWECNCEFSKIINLRGIGATLTIGTEAICVSPVDQSGKKLTELNTDNICRAEKITENNRRRLRKSSLVKRPKSIFMSLIFILTVMIIGSVLGVVIVKLRKMMKRNNVSSTVRYTNMNRTLNL